MNDNIFYISVRSAVWAKPHLDFFAVRNRAYKILGARKSKPKLDGVHPIAREDRLDFSPHVELLLQDIDGDWYLVNSEDCQLRSIHQESPESIETIAFLRGSEHKEWKPGRKVYFKASRPGLVLSSDLHWDGNGECYILKN
jgi:hypothetical protein